MAEWFAAAPGDTKAHELFVAAFGLWPARHAHLPSIDEQQRAPSVTWAAGEPVEVAPALRSAGTLANRGRSRPVGDPGYSGPPVSGPRPRPSPAHDALRATLTTLGAVPLSAFGRLDAATFAGLAPPDTPR